MRNSDISIVEALLSKGANLDEVNSENETPYQTAFFFHNEQMIEFLQKYATNPSIVRPFEILCKKYLDEEVISSESEQLQSLSEQLRVLTNKLENLEQSKQ